MKLREGTGLLTAQKASPSRKSGSASCITRARVTQVMGMLRLAPEIQQHILSMPDMIHRPAITERALRPIAQLEDQRRQMDTFQALVAGPQLVPRASRLSTPCAAHAARVTEPRALT